MPSSKARSGTSLMVVVMSAYYAKAYAVPDADRVLLTRSTPAIQVTATCSSSFAWMNNGKGQSPCDVAAWTQEACSTTPWTIPALQSGYQYDAPNTTTANYCTCSWAAYNLVSACTVCQNSNAFPSWGSWQINCTNYESSTTYFPSDKGITLASQSAIPFWAGTNPQTWSDATFNETQAQLIANQNHPDLTGTPVSATPTPTQTATSSKKSNAGPIAGGVVGGVTLIFLIFVFFTCGIVKRRKRLQQQKIYHSPDRPDLPHMGSMSDSSQMYLEPNGSGTPPGLQVSPGMQPVISGVPPLLYPVQQHVPQMSNGMTFTATGAGTVAHAPVSPTATSAHGHVPAPSVQSLGGAISSMGFNAPAGATSPTRTVSPSISQTSPEDVISPFIVIGTPPRPAEKGGGGYSGTTNRDTSDDRPPVSPSVISSSSTFVQRSTRMNPPAYTTAPTSGEVRTMAPTTPTTDQKHEYVASETTGPDASPVENTGIGTGGTGRATYGSAIPQGWGGSTTTRTSEPEDTLVGEGDLPGLKDPNVVVSGVRYGVI